MSRRPASFTQADVARVLRAAQQVGANRVEVKVGETTVTISFDNDNQALDSTGTADSTHSKVVL